MTRAKPVFTTSRPSMTVPLRRLCLLCISLVETENTRPGFCVVDYLQSTRVLQIDYELEWRASCRTFYLSLEMHPSHHHVQDYPGCVGYYSLIVSSRQELSSPIVCSTARSLIVSSILHG